MNDEIRDSVSALAHAEQSAAALQKQTIGTTVAMVGFALASAAVLLILGLGTGPGRVLGATVLGVAAAAALSIVASTAKARTRDFTRRYLVTIGTWGIFYVFFVVVGLAVLSPAPVWFWILGAVLVALPGLWFAYTSRGSKVVR